MQKKRIVTSLDKISPDVKKLILEQYPDGWKDRVRRIDLPNGTSFYAIMVDSSNTTYLIKVNVKVDTKEDVEKAEEKKEAYHDEDDGDNEDTMSDDEPDED